MKFLTTTILLLSAVATLGKKEGHIEFERSKLIVSLQDRQLDGSKSSKSGDKAGKHSSSYIFAKSSKASHKSSKSSYLQARDSRDSRDARDFEAEGIEEVVTTKTQSLINGGIAKDYNGAACVGIITTMAILWN
ncbi:hypothetical protein ACHAWT_001028 [Skeletonema menzelii]